VQDVFIACVDGLKGFPQAVEAVFVRAQGQLCIVHLTRASLNYVGWKERKTLATDQERDVNGRSTNYRGRPEDAKSKAALIRAHKQPVSAYSKIKSKLGLSDDLASRLRGLFSRSKK